METLESFVRILSGGMRLKAECDFWNSHSDDYKSTIVVEVFFGALLALGAAWAFTKFPVGSINSTVPALVFFGYFGICWALNSHRNLSEKEFASKTFSEFWLFGFFNGDDFIAGIIIGGLMAGYCTYAIYSCICLHYNPVTHENLVDGTPQTVSAQALQAMPHAAQVAHVAGAHANATATRAHASGSHAHDSVHSDHNNLHSAH